MILSENIFLNGQRTRFGIGDTGVGDLLAYRAEWEPFIQAHLELWRQLNAMFESVPEAKQCPASLLDAAAIAALNPTMRTFCYDLVVTRAYTSDTNPLGILAQWNAWKNKSDVEILAGAKDMLEWHQSVVLQVGGPYTDDLLKLAKRWNLTITLPPVPEFSFQQEVITRIEGALVATRGVLKVIGYGVGETLVVAGNVTQAVAEGVSESAKAIPKALSNAWTWVGVTAVAAVVGGALLIYYIPKHAR